MRAPAACCISRHTSVLLPAIWQPTLAHWIFHTHTQVENVAQRLKESLANPPKLPATPTNAAALKQTTSITSNSSNSKHRVKSEDGRAGGSELSAAHTQAATMTPASPAGNLRRPHLRPETSKGRLLSPIQGSLAGSPVTAADESTSGQ